MWPKSSESSSVSVSAPQFTATNGRSLRGERTWMARATSSLPVPDSPVISTVLPVGAIVSTISNTCSMALLFPMMLANWLAECIARFSSTFSCCRRLRSSSLRIRKRRTSVLNGFST